MSNTTNPRKKRFLNGALAALLAAAVVSAALMTGCSSNDDKSKSTGDSVVVETKVEEHVVNGVYVDENGNAITDPSGNPIPASTAATEAKQQSKAQSSAATSKAESKAQSSAATSKAESKAQSSAATSKAESSAASSSSGSGSRKPTPSSAQDGSTKKTTTEDASAKELTIGGKSFKVGDKIKCTYYLMVPNMMLNFQGRVEFDSSMLKMTDAYLVAPASYNAIINNNKDGKVIFNGSDLSGYDFTDPGYDFLVVEYEVLKTGSTEPAITFEVITDTSENAYAGNNGALVNGAKIRAVYE